MSRFNPMRRFRPSNSSHPKSEMPPWHREHDVFTPMGRVEDYGRFLRGLRGPRLPNDGVPFILKLVGLTFLAVVGTGIVIEVVKAIIR
jgi:hypothetical protein